MNKNIKMNTIPKININPYSRCNGCKHSFKQGDVMYCKIFKVATVKISPEKNFDYYLEVEAARSDNKLCGLYAKYFEQKD